MAHQVLSKLCGLTAHEEVLVLEDLLLGELAVLHRMQQSERQSLS